MSHEIYPNYVEINGENLAIFTFKRHIYKKFYGLGPMDSAALKRCC